MRSNSVAAFVISILSASMPSFVLADQPSSSEKTQSVVVAARDLEKGSTGLESALEERQIPARTAPVDAVSSMSGVVGRNLSERYSKGK